MNNPKKNFILENTYEVHQYTADGTRGGQIFKPRDRESHGRRLLKQLDSVWQSNEQQRAMFAAIKERQGTYIEFRGAENCDLVSKSLENATQGISLLNYRNEISDDGVVVQAATVFVPVGKENYFNKKIQEYLEQDTSAGNAKNKALVESIETIKLAVVSSFWIGDVKYIPMVTSEWCEYWLRTKELEEREVATQFYNLCDKMEIQHKNTCIVFPEKVVVLAKTNNAKIQELINECNAIAEIRRAPEVASFYTRMYGREANEWILDLKDRLLLGQSEVCVCILDTGVNYSHPLLKDILASEHAQTVEIEWGTDDKDGHGTEMAGLCEYFDLEPILSGRESVEINHRLESVKILPSAGTDNSPELYGAITANASSMAEIANPQAKRVFCMAVTADKYITKDGAPSSWSAELDSIIAGVIDGIKKLCVVSAGNVQFNELKSAQYPSANINHPIEDPGQSWNAITVGAYSNRIQLDDKVFKGWNPIADVGELCPFSSTSITWDNKWPIKPEILMDGGNAITDGTNIDICDDVSILTTNKDVIGRPFTTTNATSAATAQAAYMAAELMSAYPSLWEESIRALMVHSAQWTEQMKAQFCVNKKKSGGIRSLLRCCGYGIADLERAKSSMGNSVNMIIQAELQPYCKQNNDYKMKDMHLHKLPWPTELLQSLDNTIVSMKVTLSYYVEPAPDQKGWNNKYRYASNALRFEVINKDQNKEDFLKRVNAEIRGEDKKDKGEGSAGSSRWFLGKDNRDVGSIHSDIWTGPAVDLADCSYIAVFPVIGWWRERHHLGRYDDTMRYSLVVSISTPEESVDFYTPIQTIIEQQVATEIEIEV